MKTKGSVLSRVVKFIFATILLWCAASNANAQIVGLTNNNSVAIIDLGTSDGMKAWYVDGQNQLRQQWFWYGIGGSAESPINAISAPVFSVVNNRLLSVQYANAQIAVGIDYLLTGLNPGSGLSDIGETITIRNLSAVPQAFHFFQYSDFDLGGPGNDVVQLGKNLSGKFNEAAQIDPFAALTETVVTPGANHGEARPFNLTLASLNDGAQTTLIDNLAPVGPGNVTWAFQWDFTLAPNGSFIISKDKYLQITNVPEPTSVVIGLIGLGFIARKLRAARR